jgi:hypothetical protein
VSFKFQTISDRLQERQDYWQCWPRLSRLGLSKIYSKTCLV